MQETWEGDMALTVAKSLPAGLHLYNTLTGELAAQTRLKFVILIDGTDYILFWMLSVDDCVSLYSAGIHTNSNLFVWNGREVSKDNFKGDYLLLSILTVL